MKHGDKLKLSISEANGIDNKFVQGIFQGWEGHDTISFRQGREEFLTHYGSVVEINGEMV